MIDFSRDHFVNWTVVLAVTVLLAVAASEELSSHREHGHSRSHREAAESRSTEGLQANRWIVVTTVNYPTETMKRLAAAPGWKVVVVADLKTPKDWKLENVIMLTMEEQAKLGYKIFPLLPNNHYGRKNLGYLYAIQHGATEVYETDDDNELKNPENLALPTFEGMEYYVYNATGVCNPYEYFGLPHIWPRGYPLDQIRQSHCNNFTRRSANPLILQGLADLDPDVDAIFRLTQPMNVNFRADIPSVVLPEGVMCPWNSQNTLFQRDALWGLLIPVTTTFRVCDIWRSYWVQRLLWEVGGHLAFGAPTVDQYRNAHNLLRDFRDELPLYELAGPLVKLLNEWQAPAGADLPGLMKNLAQTMADAKMWEQGDADLMAAWVADLQAIGYAFPALHRQQAAPAALGQQRLLLDAAPGKQPAVAPRTPLHWQRHSSIVAVVVFSIAYDGWETTYKILKEAYTPIFGTVVFTGQVQRPEGMPASERWVECECAAGALQYACYANAMQEYPAPADGGHLIIGDDTIISHCQLARFNASKIWFPRAVQPIRENMEECLQRKSSNGEYTYLYSHTNRAAMINALSAFSKGPFHNKFGERIQAKLGDNLQMAHFGGDPTDALYIPARLSTDFIHATSPFLQGWIHHEVAVPALLGIISNGTDDFQVFRPLYYWHLFCEECRHKMAESPENYLKPSRLAGNAFMLHPYKFSWKGLADKFWDWWSSSACIGEAAIDNSWSGTTGISICGPAAYQNEPEGHRFSNLFFDKDEHVIRSP